MALSTETKAWLAGLKAEGNLSDEAYRQLEQSLEGSSKADEYVKGSQLRQADYSRAMASVQTAKGEVEMAAQALKAKEDAVTRYQAELGTWKAGADVNFQNALQEREKALNKANAAMARLKSLAVANGLPEDEVLKDLDVTPVPNSPKPGEQPIDTSRFITRENLQQTVQESALIDATIYDLSVEYQELTGKPLKGAGLLVQEAIKANRPLGDYIAQKFDFKGLRQKASDADVQRRIDEAVKAKETEILSRTNLPGANSGLRTDLKGSPIFDAAHEGALKNPPTEGGGGVSAAVAAFNSGKFRPGQR